jgi:rhodanese-related sulfurtransferase
MFKSAHELVQEARVHVTEISISDIQQLISTSEALVIDVREPHEYREGHLPGAVNIPRGVLEFQISNDASLQQLDRSLIVYCKTSGRAALATVALQTMGFQNVVSLAGGFQAWITGNCPVDKPADISFE